MNSAKISLKADILCVQSSDLLKGARDAKAKELFDIAAYQIRTELNLMAAALSVEQKTAAMKASQKVADQIEADLIKEVKGLVQEVEKLLQEDKRGNDKAGDQAQKKTKDAADEIEETLPEFGHKIRKAVETAIKKKLPGTVKSASSGGFRGIKLKAKFEHGGASAETVKEFQDAAKSLDQAGESAVTKSREDRKAIDGIKLSIKDQLNAASKASATNAGDAAQKFNEQIPQNARSLGKELTDYQDRVEGYKDLLTKTGKTLEVESRELSKDLSTPTFRAKKDKFDRVRKELQELQKVVDKRVQDVKQVAGMFRDADQLETAKQYQLRLAAVNAQLARFGDINAEPFNKAAEQMMIEAKKKA